MSDSTMQGGGAERPPAHDEPQHAVPGAGAARTAAATALGAFAGAAAGLGTMIVGPLGAIVGAIVNAELAAVGSHVTVVESAYTPAYDEHYRALWESDPDRLADVPFDTVRPAYQFGHVAAYQASFVGRDFVAAEADLRALWERELRAMHGEWDGVRQHVCDAYGHSRAENLGIRRQEGVIGTGGSAVDPLELARARAGLASRPDSPEGDEPLFPTDLTATAPGAGDAVGGGSLGEGAELPADRIYHQGPPPPP